MACKGLGGRGERRAEAGTAVQAETMHCSLGQVRVLLVWEFGSFVMDKLMVHAMVLE